MQPDAGRKHLSPYLILKYFIASIQISEQKSAEYTQLFSRRLSERDIFPFPRSSRSDCENVARRAAQQFSLFVGRARVAHLFAPQRALVVLVPI